jgi:hypothetical protein
MSAYKVVVLNEPCRTCLGGTEYSVEGPDGICIGTSWVEFEDVDEAEYWCDLLNTAFEEGKKSYG